MQLKTRVLCPIPNVQSSGTTLLNLAIPLIDVSQIDFAVVKDSKLMKKYATPSMIPGDC